jgi:DNA-binding transcriptional LysR family regulator
VDYNRMAILAAVVENGSMSAAARELGLTPSAISQQIRQLEKESQVTLLRRSTRRLTLTEAGEALYEACTAMRSAASVAEQRLAEFRDAPVGELAISMPVGFAARHLTAALGPLVTEHPELSLRLVVTDDRLDLIEQRLDIAIRIGAPQRSSSLVMRHLADWENLLCAAPAYLDRRGAPETPEDLAAHHFLMLPSWHHPADVLTGPDGRTHRLVVKARVVSNNQLSLKALTLAGLGLSMHVEPEISEELREGLLVRVLPDWSLPVLSVDAIMPPLSKQPAKVRCAVDLLRSYFRRCRNVR